MQLQKLKKVLFANAVFSGLSGLDFLLFNKSLTNLMQLPSTTILLVIGIGLLCFSGILFWLARQKTLKAKQVKAIIWQDWLWVMGSIGILATPAFGISSLGLLLIGLVAVVVAVFALLQQRYLRDGADGIG